MSYVLTKFIMVMPPCASWALPCLIWICCCALVSIQAVNLHFVRIRLFQYSSLQQNYKRQMFCQYFKRCILKQHVLDISLALPCGYTHPSTTSMVCLSTPRRATLFFSLHTCSAGFSRHNLLFMIYQFRAYTSPKPQRPIVKNTWLLMGSDGATLT